MPNDVFEAPLELEIELLESGPPTADSYPYPSLSPSGAKKRRTFRAVILENQFLRATFIPALGGRLLSLFDKRTGVELLSSSPLNPVAGSRRGARLDAGIQLHLDGRERLTSLGEVLIAAEEPDDDRPAGVWLSEAVTGTGVSWHLHASLPDDRAEIRLEARVFNRTLADVPYAGGFTLPALASSRSDGAVFFTAESGRGIALIPERGRWFASITDGNLTLRRFDQPRLLSARQLDSWVVSIVPVSGLDGLGAVSRHGAVFVADDHVQIRSTEQISNAKLVLFTRSGKSLEAPVSLFPESLLKMALPEPVAGVALVDSGKNVILKWEGDWCDIPMAVDHTNTTHTTNGTDWVYKTYENEELEEATFDIPTRAIAHSLLGVRALAAGTPEEADARFEQSLLYNAEDHLTWWMKAMARRIGTADPGETPELLNAHFLAPLEPALRAESYLAQPQTLEKDPSALLKPMADFPESFVEVASLLVEAELYEQASRWIDEAIRHADLPMLRYLLAYSHLQATGLDFEAGQHVATAGRLPLGPPYPWRRIEIKVVEDLSAQFPTDERLRELVALLDKCRP